MTLPNFLIIGAARSGTTSLYGYLREHPDIFVSPRKELGYFSLEESPRTIFQGPTISGKSQINTFERYRECFSEASHEKAVGEASPIYLYSRKAPRAIKDHLPGVKLIASLRDPVERAYSHYAFLLRLGLEFVSPFREALEREAERIKNNWDASYHYEARGFYYKQLKKYYALFDTAQIRVLVFEEFVADPQTTLTEVLEYLEVSSSFLPDLAKRYNIVSSQGDPASSAIIADEKTGPVSASKHIPEDLRERLQERCREDVLRTQELVDKDLSAWLR